MTTEITTETKTREFEGFSIVDGNDFVLTLNARTGPVDMNCQEIMALALSKGAVFGNGQAQNDIVQITGNSYNIISQCRDSQKWILAKSSFELLNTSLDDKQIAKIAPKSTNGKSETNGDNGADVKIKFSATHATNLGKAIFASVPTESKKYLAHYDSENSAFQGENKKAVVIRCAVDYFVRGLQVSIASIKYNSERVIRESEQVKKLEKLEKLEIAAKSTLLAMGITEETDGYKEKLVAQMTLLKTVLELI